MLKRIGLLGLAGVLAGPGPAVADKPSGLPVEVRPQGKEPPPIDRDFHAAERPGRVTVPAQEEKAAPGSLAELVTGVREWVLSYLIVPLGTVPVRE
jgi:hypothetical protein